MCVFDTANVEFYSTVSFASKLLRITLLLTKLVLNIAGMVAPMDVLSLLNALCFTIYVQAYH